jgi:hypothetical protein
MRQPDVFDWVFYAIMFSVLGYWAFAQIRYLVRRSRRSRWPTVDAVIQKGAVGAIPMGKGQPIPASFMGYAYVVQGVRYAGFFALLGNETLTQTLYDNLAGSAIQIHYDPSDPNVSFLEDYKDFRFGGLKATQSPDTLQYAPSFDLQDAIRGATARK